jgi:hypothetical protein
MHLDLACGGAALQMVRALGCTDGLSLSSHWQWPVLPHQGPEAKETSQWNQGNKPLPICPFSVSE